MEFLNQFPDPWTEIADGLFWFSLACIATWEFFRPLRPLEHSFSIRWMNNIALAVINIGIYKFLTGLPPFDLHALAERSDDGFLTVVELPVWGTLLLVVVWLDFVSYATH